MPPRLPRAPWLSWLAAGSSLLLLVVYLSLAAHLRLALGHWPVPMFEDFSTPLFRAHLKLLWAVLFWAAIPAVFVYRACWSVPRWVPALEAAARGQVGALVLGWVLLATAHLADPTTFAAWLAD